MQLEMGVNPSGTSASIAARFAANDAGGARANSSPTLNQSANVTYAAGWRAAYSKVGREVSWNFNLAVTGAGASGTDIAIGLPYGAPTAAIGDIIGAGYVYDSSAATMFHFQLVVTSTTFAKFQYIAAANVFLGAGQPLVLASGDVVRGNARYEAAS